MSENLLKTALWEEHQKLGARLVPFAGYSMPVQYEGVMAEHQRVRNDLGIFDVSHMGLVKLSGNDAAKVIDLVFTRHAAALTVGTAAYGLFCNENGGSIDDLIVYRSGEEEFYIVFNAGNKHNDLAHIQQQQKLSGLNNCTFEVLFESHSLLALQGPKCVEFLNSLEFVESQTHFKAFTLEETTLLGTKVIVAHTGYTGEKGVEIFCHSIDVVNLWRNILEKAKPFNIGPIGLGARDTLRLEMGYSLYGHELSLEINPVEAGLSWAVDFTKNNFLGKNALLNAKEQRKRKMISLISDEKRAPRQGMDVYSGDECVGQITSGTFAPSVEKSIGLALVNNPSSGPYSVDIRGTRYAFSECKRPFWKGQKG